MSSDEEDAGGFGSDHEEVEEEEEDDAGGFGDADEDEEEDGVGFGDADEDEGGGGDAPEPEPEPEPEPAKPTRPKVPAAETGAWEKYFATVSKKGCANCYEHPGIKKIWRTGVTKKIKGVADNAEAHVFYRNLLTFMGDLAQSGGGSGGPSIGAFGGAVVPTTRETIEELCWNGLKSKKYRVELYCQLLKQLYQTSSKMSHARGFILLNMYLGSFPPPADMIPAIIEIISLGPSAYIQYSQARLAMARTNPSARKQPPIKEELGSVKSRKPIVFPVTVPGQGQALAIELESLTTVSELLDQVAAKCGITKVEGYGLRIVSQAGVAASMGKGKKYVLDVIARYDREAERRGEDEDNRTFKMVFAKEETASWHDDPADDRIGLQIAADQLFSAVQSNLWQFETEAEYVHLVATKAYCEYASDLPLGDEFDGYVASMLPSNMVLDGKKKPKKPDWAKKAADWNEVIEKAHARLECTKSHIPKDVVQMTQFDKTREKWPHFYASWYDCEFIMGPGVRVLKGGKYVNADLSSCFVAISEAGFHVGYASKPRDVLQAWPWTAVDEVKKAKDGSLELKTLAEPTKHTDAGQYSFKVLRGADIADLVKLATRLKSNAGD